MQYTHTEGKINSPIVLADLARRGRDGGRAIGIAASTADGEVGVSFQGGGRSSGHDKSLCGGREKRVVWLGKKLGRQGGGEVDYYLFILYLLRYEGTLCLSCSFLSIYKNKLSNTQMRPRQPAVPTAAAPPPPPPPLPSQLLQLQKRLQRRHDRRRHVLWLIPSFQPKHNFVSSKRL